ncbi:TetR/AcrR family transcriptional regulator [Bradyrhizobium sp.]|uniref:TetR/AcrR family transcriptional regulator n=1 Tax=Bradyrhizobium sp. TaxID=376 RepID=UPI001D22F320|nr:TetR/AcrR family transcriptional regulator [Bradyrhizobium sp.]MBI5321949.1 TetR/AcrR family transcriptional regulator [Bradyrhizobium sp.]
MASKRRARADRDAAATRQKLLDAAVDCLVELGVAGTTTLAVQRRAGTSRGALLHHFPTHADLLAASVAELVKRNEQAVAASRAGSSEPGDPLRAAVNALAYAGRQPAYLAELELWAVARTDRPLKQALIAAERAARREIDRVYAELFGKWSDAEAYPVAAALTQNFLRGLAISENLRGSAARREQLLSAWTDAMRMMLEKSPKEATAPAIRG